jgi:hypothetical protein
MDEGGNSREVKESDGKKEVEDRGDVVVSDGVQLCFAFMMEKSG